MLLLRLIMNLGWFHGVLLTLVSAVLIYVIFYLGISARAFQVVPGLKGSTLYWPKVRVDECAEIMKQKLDR